MERYLAIAKSGKHIGFLSLCTMALFPLAFTFCIDVIIRRVSIQTIYFSERPQIMRPTKWLRDALRGLDILALDTGAPR